MAKIKNIGSTFDSLLEEEGITAEVEASAIKRVLAWQIAEEMKKQKINKIEMARKMKMSRSSVDRLLDPDNSNLTLRNLEKAAHVLHKVVKIELSDLL